MVCRRRGTSTKFVQTLWSEALKERVFNWDINASVRNELSGSI